MFGRAEEVQYLRAELAKERDRYDRLTKRFGELIAGLRRDGFVAPDPADQTPGPDLASEDIAPSIDVVIEEFAELSPQPDATRRQLSKFAALKSTQGKSDPEIVALIRKGGDGADDAFDDDAYI